MFPRRALGPRPGWFRLYNRLPNDPKIAALDDRTFRYWLLTLCVASQHYGKLPPIDEFAFYLRIDRPTAEQLIQTLRAKDLLDEIDGDLIPHNWSEHQYESDNSTPRVKRFRERKRNAVGNVSETSPDTDSNAETDSDQNRAANAALARVRHDGWPDDYQSQFWNKYPHKVGKIRAFKLLTQVRKKGVTWPDLMNGVDIYISSKPRDREWCNPATFLGEGRWEDVPAKSKRNRSLTDAADDLIKKVAEFTGDNLAKSAADVHAANYPAPNLLLEHKPK